LVGATQPDGAGPVADAGVVLGVVPAGATQLEGAAEGAAVLADPVGATQLLVLGAEAVAVGDVPVGVDCSLASNPADGEPSAGSAWDCSKAMIAPRVLGPM
jgi:hypothetical protein